jgi:hypothetical protein
MLKLSILSVSYIQIWDVHYILTPKKVTTSPPLIYSLKWKRLKLYIWLNAKKYSIQ